MSALRLGSDGSYGIAPPLRTNQRLSENAICRTVFVTAFFVLSTLYHVRAQKSNVFLRKILFFIIPTKTPYPSHQKLGKLPVDKRSGLWLNVIYILYKDFDGKFAPIGCSREPAVGVSRCGRFARSDSRVGPANSTLSSGARLPPLRDRTCWSLK